MQNLLIIEDDTTQSYLWVNCICKEIQNIRLYSIVSTGKEAIDIINEGKADIIILDLKLPDMTGIDIISYISNNNIIKYKKSLIVITNEMKLLARVINNKYIYGYCSKDNDIDFITKQIKDIIRIKEENRYESSLGKQIKKELESINFNFSYIGTKYLYESIYECCLKEDYNNINLNKEIYPIISRKYSKTENLIKSNIFHSIDAMYCNAKEDTLSKYFGYKIIDKPRTKELITTVCQKIYRKRFIKIKKNKYLKC